MVWGSAISVREMFEPVGGILAKVWESRSSCWEAARKPGLTNADRSRGECSSAAESRGANSCEVSQFAIDVCRLSALRGAKMLRDDFCSSENMLSFSSGMGPIPDAPNFAINRSTFDGSLRVFHITSTGKSTACLDYQSKILFEDVDVGQQQPPDVQLGHLHLFDLLKF